MKQKRIKLRTLGVCLGGALVTGDTLVQAQAPPGQEAARFEKLEQENKNLRQRLEALESVAKKEGILPSGGQTDHAIKALSESTLSGFVTTSYFHDTSNPPGGISPGYLWSRRNDSFSLNKVKLTLASPPVERSGDKWDAAYRASLIFGQDAPLVNIVPSTLPNASFSNVREAYLEMNVPVGTGLNVRVGEMISLLNYESGDGGAANDNASQGFQWFFTGNGPAAGAQLGYTLTDWLDVKVRVQNGLYAGPVDNNNSKTVVTSIGLKPNDKIWLSLIGFGGREDSFTKLVKGGSLLAGYQFDPKWHFGTELDYFSFRSMAKDSPVYSGGLWVSYALTDKILPAVRAEFLSDKHGVDFSGGALGFANPVGTGQDISSVAFTLNIKPTPSIKIQPEIRFDHTSLKDGFGKKADRVIVGAGASYVF